MGVVVTVLLAFVTLLVSVLLVRQVNDSHTLARVDERTQMLFTGLKTLGNRVDGLETRERQR